MKKIFFESLGKMPDYSKAVIYKIQHVTKPELLYVGCTTNFNARRHQHKCRSTNVDDKEYNVYKYKMIRENGGWDMFEMKPIKQISCKSKLEAEIEEERVRNELKAGLNQKIQVSKLRSLPFLSLRRPIYTEADLVDEITFSPPLQNAIQSS